MLISLEPNQSELIGTASPSTQFDLRIVRAIRSFLSFVIFGILCFIALARASADEPVDWYHWRGPEQNGISREKNLPERWSPRGENLVWRNEAFGTRCTPIAMNGKLYFVARAFPETTQEGERTVCLDAETGELIWESIHNIFLTDAPAERVGWASVIGDPETGNVYVLGLGCTLQCLNGDSGEILWERPLNEEYGMLSTYGGRTNFPVIFENLLVVSGVMTQWGEHAVPAHRFLAFDKHSGEPVWFMSTRPRPEDTTYSTPVFTVFNGQAAMVFGGGDGALHAVQPRTGKPIWSYEVSQRGFNTTPLIWDNIVYCAHAEKNRADTTILGAAFALDGRRTGSIGEDQLLWKVNAKTVGRSGPLMVDGRLYMVEDGGTLVVFDPQSGSIVEERKVGRIMFGSLVYGDGKIYCAEATGTFWVFQPTSEGLKEISRTRLSNEEILSSPIIYRGRIYLTTTEAIYCIGNPDRTIEADPIPAAPEELPVSDDQQVAHIQLVPVEALARPGESIDYRVLAFNFRGQSLGEVAADLAVSDHGSLNGMTLKTDDAVGHVALDVTATVGDLTSKARVRLVPPLPWKFDFNDGKVPVTWIGAAYRHQPKEFDGEKCLVKVSTIPKGTRSQLWMGQSDYHDYTVEADFFAAPGDLRPDMGLINQRYTLDMMGKDQLQIRSWTPRLELRFAKTIPFQWQAGQWYRMKFQSENRDDRVVLRGKVWARGEAEPSDWMIEAADLTPNTLGSPGLFGNATLGEFYIDNVEVYANKN